MPVLKAISLFIWNDFRCKAVEPLILIRFLKGQSAGSSSQINLNPDDEEDSENDNDDDPTYLSDSN